MFRFSKSKHPDFLAVYHSAENLFHDLPIVRRRRLARRYFSVLKFFAFFLAAFFILVLASFGSQFIIVKDMYAQAIAGKSAIEDAADSAMMEKFEEATELSREAQEHFQASLAGLEKIKKGFVVSRVPYLYGQVESAGHLLSAAGILSGTLEKGVGFAAGLEGLLGEGKKTNFSKFSPADKEKILKRIYLAGPELAGIREDLIEASSELEKIDFRGALFPFRDKITDLQEKMADGEELLAKAIPVSEIVPRLVGYPAKSTYLILLQNKDELRPTGGFIGTYGILELNAGDIARLDTHDIYHMDMPVQKKIDVIPPDPIKKYLNKKWYMRDANWSPDWPTTAEKLLWFYRLENPLLPPKDQINKFDGDFSGVIGITPDLIIGLLKITGPVVVGGQEYNRDNFTEILQYKVEKGYEQLGVPSWQRKEVIGDIVKELKIRLFDLPSSRWGEILDVFSSNALKKDLLVYMKDRDLQTAVKDQGWAGEMKKSGQDYLMVVDSNMAALKTDAVMSRRIDYRVEQRTDGLFAKLDVNYAHGGGKDWRTDTYKTYTRIYVPLGSRLVKESGAAGGFETGTESDKTYFGGFITVAPGKIGTVHLEYKLPDRLQNQSRYELYMQKQPGKYVGDLLVDLNTGKGVKSYSPTGFYANSTDKGGIKWETDLGTDKIFTINH